MAPASAACSTALSAVGTQVDERSDLFAFGILLYELLAGVHPFTRASPSGTLSAILRETPSPISQYAKDAPQAAGDVGSATGEGAGTTVSVVP